MQAVRSALTSLEPAGVPIRNGLKLVISSSKNQNIKQEAFHFGAGAIVLTPKMFHDPAVQHTEEAIGVKGGGAGAECLGVAHQLARGLPKASREGVIGAGVVVHEIGHVMHKIMNPDEFLDATQSVGDEGTTTESKAKSQAASKVSYYAWMNGAPPAEIVAEVFTGLTQGKKYPRDVIAVYKKYGGPKVWRREADAILEVRPDHFTSTSLVGDQPKAGSVQHVFTWDSSTGSVLDLKGILTREKVAFRSDPIAFMPVYKDYRREPDDTSVKMAELHGNTLLKDGPKAEDCGGTDTHSPGHGPFFDDRAGFAKTVGTLIADQVYQYKDFDGTWKDIPNSTFTITRKMRKKKGSWELETTKAGQGSNATARVTVYDRMEDVPPNLLGAH
jgi:hypothetical protein